MRTNKLLKHLLFSGIIAIILGCDDNKKTEIQNSNFFPMSLESNWTYNNGDSTISVYAIGVDEFNGMTYFKLNSFPSPLHSVPGVTLGSNNIEGNGWIRADENNAYLRLELNTGNLRTSPFEINILKNEDNKEIWNDELEIEYYIGSNPDPSVVSSVVYSFEMVNKDVKKSIGGNSYEDVIVIQYSVSISYFDEPFKVELTGEYWFAKSIGIVFSSDISTANGSLVEREFFIED